MVRYGVPDIISNTVVSIFVDSRGWVWTGTDNGVSVFNGKRWVSANTDIGLIWNDVDQGSLFEDTDGSMWIGTSQGLSHLHDPTGLFKEQALKPVITSVMIGDTDYHENAVAYTRDPLEIRFGTLNFEADGTVRFRYRLQGVDKAWAETSSGYARYASIPSGHHVFEVVAYDPLTHQVSAPVSILLRMKAPWWLWWPMVLLYALVICALGYALVRLRTRMLLRQQHMLQREVENRTKEMREAQAALQILATQDSLTKLLTRGEIQARLVGSLIAESSHSHLTVGLIDIDHFKKINDRHGHLAGDEILEEMGRRMRQALKPDEYAGRYGGEEILVVLMSHDDRGTDRIRELNDRLCGEPFIVDGESIQVTVSIGVASARARDSWKSLIGRADKALYEAKESGRNCVIVSFGTRDGELLSRHP
jgi:diguanylate cyclase (GGDEF)-like protein